MIDLFDGLDDTFRDILIQWMRTPTHHREICNHALKKPVYRSPPSLTSVHRLALKEKTLNFRTYKQGWMQPPPPFPYAPLLSEVFLSFPLMTLIKLEARRLVFPLCALSIGRICSLMFRCVM